MAIAEGFALRPLRALSDGANSTWFLPTGDPKSARKGWITAMKPMGAITIDAGAVAALGRGKSLLPAGVTGVSEFFERGDPVSVLAPNGQCIGLGLSRYTAREVALIKGSQTKNIEGILGYPGRSVLIHRDDMAL